MIGLQLLPWQQGSMMMLQNSNRGGQFRSDNGKENISGLGLNFDLKDIK